MTDYTDLYDADTAELIGPATPAQIAASLAADEEGGLIHIDADGDVIARRDWLPEYGPIRMVYAA